jgi:hypothetical protein
MSALIFANIANDPAKVMLIELLELIPNSTIARFEEQQQQH